MTGGKCRRCWITKNARMVWCNGCEGWYCSEPCWRIEETAHNFRTCGRR